MNTKKMISQALLIVLVLSLAGPVVMPQAMAYSGYKNLYTGPVDGGKTYPYNGCLVHFEISNGSGSAVYVTISSPAYAMKNVTMSQYQGYYYFDALRVYVADVNKTTGVINVDISMPEGSSSGDPTTPAGTKLTCDTPGQLVLAGDIVSFPITIQNNNNEDKTYSLSHEAGVEWSIRFTSGDKGIYKVYVPKQQSRVVNLEIRTTGASTVGEKTITAKVDGQSIDVFVYITSVNQSAEVTTKVSSKIASIGDKIYYDVRIKNLQSKENIYKLSVTGLPENWYYRFKEDAGSVEEIGEAVIAGSGEKNLVLEIVPPYSVTPGDYNFTAVVITPDSIRIEKELTLKLKSDVSMSMVSSRLAYNAKPGEAFNIDVYVSNNGNGGALTNIYLETEAPDGWQVQVTPNKTTSLKAGESQTFRVKVTPPGNIVASDYDVTIKAKSDQAEKEKSYRISITVDSYVPVIGGVIIVLVVIGLGIVYWKYGRR